MVYLGYLPIILKKTARYHFPTIVAGNHTRTLRFLQEKYAFKIKALGTSAKSNVRSAQIGLAFCIF